jgi:hypothetical protein
MRVRNISIKGLMTASIAVVLMVTMSCSRNGQPIMPIKSGSYLQDEMTLIKLPDGEGENVIGLFRRENVITAVTSNGIFRSVNSKWEGKPAGTGWVAAIQDPDGKIWVATVNSIICTEEGKESMLPGDAKNDTILVLFPGKEKTILVGTTSGLLSWNGTWETVPETKGKRVNDITADAKGDIWLATNDGLLRTMAGKWVNMDDLLMAAGLRRTYFAVEYNSEKGEIIFGGLYCAGGIAENGDHWILRGADGLPYGPVKKIAASNGDLWLGTHKGAIRKNGSWSYFNGKRWMPDNIVNDILPIDKTTTWIATPKGISKIQQVAMTLEQKTAIFEERIMKRHSRHGLVSDSRLKEPGDLNTNMMVPSDNDGLWTSIYLAAECFRYAVTREQEAKENAIRAFEAMEKLETITGISGFPARSYVGPGEAPAKDGQWHMAKDSTWKWKGDTSSDEIVGHMFAYPLFYDLVAEGEMKERAKKLVDRIMGHIVGNNFNLIDLDGKPTRWGVWNPDSLNNSLEWIYEKGINSLQILSFLKAAYHMTGNEKYEKAYLTLVKDHHYVENMVTQKMYGPFDINHSDDELSFLPYYILFRYAKETDLLPLYSKSILRSWTVEEADRIPIWNIIASVSLKRDCGMAVALEELQQIPMDMIDWRMENSHRWDLQADQLVDRFGKPQATRPIPTPERAVTKWNSNTYLFDSGSGGYREEDGSYFLLPYWMARYHRVITESKN